MITEIKLIRYRLSSEKNYDITSDGVQFLKEKKRVLQSYRLSGILLLNVIHNYVILLESYFNIYMTDYIIQL